jgi:mannose-1-phosphate guanylyltransferase
MPDRYIVIMAGGRGERFWPESRLTRPKQLLPIVGDKAMLAQTIERLEGLVPVENIFVITNAAQRDAVLEVCPELDPDKVIGEPVGRDTAAAVGLATILVNRESANATFAMLPADAVIYDVEGFRSTLATAFSAAEASPVLATVGIKAQFPATGYGYIQQGEEVGQFAGKAVFRVKRFVEKPKIEIAKSYLESGDYFWNAGMFIWSVAAITAEMEKNTPSLWASLQAINNGLDEGKAVDPLLEEHYSKLEKISIDYAIIEKAEDIVMVESQFDWDDVGEWTALERHYPADDNGNVSRGVVLAQDSKDNIVFSRDKSRLVTLLGVQDLIVVETKDATLICHKDKAQQIKDLVRTIGETEALKHLM